MKSNNSRVIRIVTVVWHGEYVDVPVTYFEPGHPMPIAYTPDSPGYDDPGSAGEVEFDTPMMSGICEEFMNALDLQDDERFVDMVFEAMNDAQI